MDKLNIKAKVIIANYGTDTLNSNFGHDILKDDRNRIPNGNFGNEIGQGIDNDLIFIDITGSFQLKQNLFLDAKLIFRKNKSPLRQFDTENTHYSISLRLNIPERLQEF